MSFITKEPDALTPSVTSRLAGRRPIPGKTVTGKSVPGSALALFALALLALAGAPTAEAYIGPGAGVALVGSFMVILVTIALVFVILLTWPFRMLYRLLRRKKRDKAWIKRLIVVGFDGQEPKLTDRFLDEGKLPHFKKLKDDGGCYHRIETTYPAISPVAWSTFATGVHPAKHNIFDFLSRDRRNYLPQISSSEIGSVHRFLKLGKWKIPLEKPELRLLRKSKPFWTTLGEHHIWSTVLRVPITFPPDEFYGAELSAMAAPDLLGTQGTFFLYTTRTGGGAIKEGGVRFKLDSEGLETGHFKATIDGPPNSFIEGDPPLQVALEITLDKAAQTARVQVGEEDVTLKTGELSDWVSLLFPAGPGIKVSGMTRMQVTEMGEHFSLYMTPLSLDPENPAMPVSHPSYYSTYLAKKIGPFSTLGLAEDTWALNEDVVDDATFLKQSLDVDEERQKMFMTAIDKLDTGTLSCVFDGTDRIQHMFWRYIEDGHPAARGKEDAEHKNAIEELYKKNDAFLGEVMEKLRPGDVLMVLSDHGFASFRRGINLNVWLQENGYLVLKDGADGSTEWLQDVDWSKTRAYALGLTGMFLNIKGREAEGIVEPGEEAQALKAELIEKMSGLVDDEKGEVAINELFDPRKLYEGPYLVNGPDLIVGYNDGYRISWDGASGVLTGPVFEDNVKAWSGDHGIDPRLVPGVFFCNHPIDVDDPSLLDIAPSVLKLFGIEPPAHMDGKLLFHSEKTFSARREAGAEA